MMYLMKKIIRHDTEISLPKCMYTLRKIYTFGEPTESLEEIDLNIGKQVMKFLQAPTREMAELEQRQDQLLAKLDLLYDKIKSISQICQVHNKDVKVQNVSTESMKTPDEIVLTANPDNLPWFINIILAKLSSKVNFKWHIHSSVPSEKVGKVKDFLKNLPSSGDSKITLRLIFKCADLELKLSSLAVPILGNVNILRYLALAFPSTLPYDETDYALDGLLDLCHILERTSEKNKEAVLKSIFSCYNNGWIYKSSFCIVDIAAYTVIKQWRNCPKYVAKEWFDKLSNFQ